MSPTPGSPRRRGRLNAGPASGAPAARRGGASTGLPGGTIAGLARGVRRIARDRPAGVTLGLLTIHLMLAYLVFQPAPHTGGDNGVYVTLARALLDEGRYINLHLPGAPPHTQYPPGFPVLLAAGMLLGLTTWVRLKVLTVLVTSLGVAFSFLWIRRRRSPGLALGVGLILAISPGVLEHGHWVLSDGPFWALLMAAVWGFERLRPDRRLAFAVAVAATLAAYFTRSAGLPLLLAGGGVLALRRNWRGLGLFGLVVGVPALLWWMRARSLGGVDYVSQFWFVNPYRPDAGTVGPADLPIRIGENLVKYLTDHLPILGTG
jgi:hypothetical protein